MPPRPLAQVMGARVRRRRNADEPDPQLPQLPHFLLHCTSSHHLYRLGEQGERGCGGAVAAGVATSADLAAHLLPHTRTHWPSHLYLYLYLYWPSHRSQCQYMVAMGIIGYNDEGLQSVAWTDQTPPSLDGFFAGASNVRRRWCRCACCSGCERSTELQP